jgi:hypothetical protein
MSAVFGGPTQALELLAGDGGAGVALRTAVRRSLLLLTGLYLGCSGAIGETEQSGEACDESSFVCGDGSCIAGGEKCNGTENCPDGSDEDDCVVRCERDDYRCKDGTSCVGRDAVCDGRSDCPGGDDELTCASKECDGFQCGDGSCIAAAQKCDGSMECPTGEDESAVTCAPVSCPNPDDMRCTDGRTCVAVAEQCDGTRHCPRGEDEGAKLCADGSGGGKDEGDNEKPGDGGTGPDKPGGGGEGRPCGDISAQGVCKADELIWCDHGRLEKQSCRDDGKTCGVGADGNNTCLDMDGEPPIDCGGMPEAGTCRGNTLLFCTDAGQPTTEDCAARGEACVADDAGARCEPAAGTCGDMSYQGACNGQVLEWCNEAGERQSYDCSLSGQTCAWLDVESGYGCQASPCGELTYYGECAGDQLRYCQDGSILVEVDCRTEYGVGCGLQDDQIGYNCGAGAEGGGCGDVTFTGTCDGDVAVWCGGDSLSEYDCSVQGKTCGYVDEEVGYWCVAASESACGGLTYEGDCEGDMVLWCEDEAIRYRDCTFEGGCGYLGSEVGYWCLGEEGGGGGEVTSCDGWCGIGEVPGSDPICYCDDACVENGDCCGGIVEYEAVCGYSEPPAEEATCYEWCGAETPAPGSNPACYCDDACVENGDCCGDFSDWCY